MYSHCYDTGTFFLTQETYLSETELESSVLQFFGKV